MKKLSVIIYFLLISSSLFSMSKQSTNKITGYIHIYGNEPFSFIGFQTDDNKEYSLSQEENNQISNDSLNSLQGKHIELHGIEIPCKNKVLLPNELKDGSFIIEKIIILKD